MFEIRPPKCYFTIKTVNSEMFVKILFSGITLTRGFYIRALFLLNLLNELGKSDKMRVLSSILLFCPNKFNKFDYSGARMLILFIT